MKYSGGNYAFFLAYFYTTHPQAGRAGTAAGLGQKLDRTWLLRQKMEKFKESGRRLPLAGMLTCGGGYHLQNHPSETWGLEPQNLLKGKSIISKKLLK